MHNILEQQCNNGLEKFINLSCDLTVNENVLPLVSEDGYFKGQDMDLFDILKVVFLKQFNIKVNNIEPRIKYKLSIIKTTAKFNFKGMEERCQWKAHELYDEYSKYKDTVIDKPILLITGGTLGALSKQPVVNQLYQVDGMHRVMSALESGVNELPAYVIVYRPELSRYTLKEDRDAIVNEGSKCTWFPKYQEILEVGLDGQRKQLSRFRDYYDFSVLRDKVVVDFGGNIGQSAVEAYFNGAKEIYSFDIQEDALATGKKIAKLLGMKNTHYNHLDFNAWTFTAVIEDVVKEWDWTIFQAIYRTKEINDIKTVFRHIVENTKEGIIFEGNGEPTIDTDAFYQDIFNFSKIQFLGFCEQRPAYIIHK